MTEAGGFIDHIADCQDPEDFLELYDIDESNVKDAVYPTAKSLNKHCAELMSHVCLKDLLALQLKPSLKSLESRLAHYFCYKVLESCPSKDLVDWEAYKTNFMAVWGRPNHAIQADASGAADF